MFATGLNKTDVPWTLTQTRVRGANRRRFEIRFARGYIRALWHPRVSREPIARGAFDDAANERLLYDGTIPVDGGSSMFVQAWLVPAAYSGSYHIRVSMNAPAPLKKRLFVCLYWDSDQYTATLARGVWLFEDITEPNYSRRNGNFPTRRLRMTFEFQDDDDDTA
jgi:hypothetical protein